MQRSIGCPCFRSRQRAACARAVKTALAAVCALGSSASSAWKCCGRDAHDVMGLAAAGQLGVRVGAIMLRRVGQDAQRVGASIVRHDMLHDSIVCDKQLKRFTLPPIVLWHKGREREGGEGRNEGSASLKNDSLVPAHCTTLHKHCAAKLCLPTAASFKRAQCCGVESESRALAALRGDN